ncbi:MAG TPA: right-handed parallel beta-helix repeat-containing protein [Verrucomicrobiae bacterium]|jgi:hypothetical protein
MMTKLNRSWLAGALAVMAFLGWSPSLMAQASRTWISGVGDDANPGSRTAPCKTIAGAISKTVAGGEIDAIDPGGFGGVTITKAITLDGKGPLASILVGDASGINIAAGANDVVTIRNYAINGIGGTPSPGLFGINIISAGEVRIENCVIFGFSTNGINFASSGNTTLYVQNCQIHNCADGIYARNTSGPANIVVESCQIAQCHTGFFGDANTVASIRNSLFAQNTGTGINIAAPTATASIDNTEVSQNGTGLAVGGSAIISRDSIINNTGAGLSAAAGGSIRTIHNNLITGNNPDGASTGSLPLK